MPKIKLSALGTTTVDLPDLREHLIYECECMVMYAFADGREIKPDVVGKLGAVKAMKEPDPKGKDLEVLAAIHDHLQDAIKPALPATIVLIQTNRLKQSTLSFLGPVPLVRRLVLFSMGSLVCLLGFSLFKEVNPDSLHKGLFENSGWELLVNLIFLLSAAGVGGSFAALYKVNDLIEVGNYDPKNDAAYWAQVVLGLVSGILLSELIPIPAEQNDPVLGQDFAKPILSLLGGFSAKAVYRILSFLIEAVESLVNNAAIGRSSNKDQIFQAQMREKLATQRADMLEAMAQPNFADDFDPSASEEDIFAGSKTVVPPVPSPAPPPAENLGPDPMPDDDDDGNPQPTT